MGYGVVVVPFERASRLIRSLGPGVDPLSVEVRTAAQLVIEEGGVQMPHFNVVLNNTGVPFGIRSLRNVFAHSELYIDHGVIHMTNHHPPGTKVLQASCTVEDLVSYLWALFLAVMQLYPN